MNSNSIKMHIAAGTTSEQKVEILKTALNKRKINFEITPCDVSSEITDQPLDEATTHAGAVNRSRNAMTCCPGCTWSIGLEGGLVDQNGIYALICVANIHTKTGNDIAGSSSARALPQSVSDRIRNGVQFGEAIREYYNDESYTKDNIEKVYVEELISRRQSFAEAIGEVIEKAEEEGHLSFQSS